MNADNGYGNYNYKYNGQTQARPVNRRRKRLLKRFITAFSITLLVLSALLVSVALSLGLSPQEAIYALPQMLESNLSDGGLGSLFSVVPEHTNFLLLGTDDDNSRTDFMMAGSLNSKTKAIDIISLPRDTYVRMPQERIDILKEMGRWAPVEMKLCHAHHYAGKDVGIEFTTKQVEELLGITLSYYAIIDLDSFKELVDAIGGVEFDVPQRMYYRDPEQGLYIDLQPGLQTLDGGQAEGLIRYRKADINNPISKGYARGDLERVEVQQDFMKALITQLMQKENIIKNAPAMISTFMNYVETNAGVAEAGKYFGYLGDIKVENISTYTLPGDDETVGGVSYFFADEAETAALVNEIFYSSGEPVPEEDSFDKTIQVLNGAGVSGLASKNKGFLEEKGYTVSDIGDYSGEAKPNTRIFTSRKGLGADLAALYDGAEVIVSKTIAKNYDIVVVLGTNEN